MDVFLKDPNKPMSNDPVVFQDTVIPIISGVD